MKYFKCFRGEMASETPYNYKLTPLVSELNEGSIGAHNFILLNEDALDDAIFFSFNVVFHLHCFVNEQDVALLHCLTGLNVDGYNSATHGG